MRVLGIDLETTGVDFEKDRIIEIGLVLWDTDLKIPLRMSSQLIDEPGHPKIDSDNVPALITDEMVKEFGISMNDSRKVDLLFDFIIGLCKEARYIVAQNGNKFDKIMLKKFFDRYSKDFPDILWLDTRTDIEYPVHCHSKNLIYLAAFHGFVNPFPHRALFDIMTMLKLLDNYDIDEIIERMESPEVTLRACVTFDTKELAKAEGFSWSEFPDCPYRGSKIWYKIIKECDVTDEWIDSLEFKVKMIETRI